MASPGEPAQPPGPGRDAEVLRERDRIAGELQNEVIQRIFSIGLHLQSTAAIAIDPLVRNRVEQATNDLDHVVRVLRDAVFGLQPRLKDRGLRAGIVHLCEQLSPVPDVTFCGPVDGALHPAASVELLDVLDDALAIIRHRWAPVAIHVTAAGSAHVTTLHAVPLSGATGTGKTDQELPAIRDRAAQAGMRIEIQPGSEHIQISWHAA
jgi:signal transduction histidine kinase